MREGARKRGGGYEPVGEVSIAMITARRERVVSVETHRVLREAAEC